PKLPHLVRNIPLPSNFWTRLLFCSATKTFPLPSTATPRGAANCPSPLPVMPHLVRKVPVFVNFWIRSLFVSATKTFPLPSTVSPLGQLTCPPPEPNTPACPPVAQVSKAALPSVPTLPNVRRKVPVFVNFWMRLLPVSSTKTFPLPSTATPRGWLN